MLKQVCTATVVAAAWLLVAASPEPGPVDTESLRNIANVTYDAEKSEPSGLASIFSPRMDFDQWKPLTGRGDPLRNDPTYDYEPPVLERVHYWADETRLEREHYPERKSEVLMLGVSSRKPSVGSRPLPPRRHHRPHIPPRYEDYSYKLSDHYPMTILVPPPPPPPPPGHKPSLFIVDNTLPPPLNSHIKITDPPKLVKPTTMTPEQLTSLYALQEANLIYQSSSTTQSWVFNNSQSNPLSNNAVSSDYAGWGPTTPLDENEIANDTHNLISYEPYMFYKPMLSEAPPPPRVTKNPLLLPTFVPTALPPIKPTETSTSPTQQTWPTEPTTTAIPTDFYIDYNEQTTTDNDFITTMFQSNTDSVLKTSPGESILDMLTPMMTMPMPQPERLEDHLYAHASENVHIFNQQNPKDVAQLESMQTMQPPPITTQTESTTITQKQSHNMSPHSQNTHHKKPSAHTHDPYLHMRFTTPMPTVTSSVDSMENTKTTESPTVPMYLIIQGHSKVKTYSSKIKSTDKSDHFSNEIPKPNETNEVKHLHPTKDKYMQKPDKGDRYRCSRAQTLKSLVDEGRGSIEIQEADVGIKYDVSDGSNVPVEIYRKGIVDNDENAYETKNKGKKAIKESSRVKRQASFSGFLPDEDTVEEAVYNFLKNNNNETGITGFIAKVVTGGALDDLDDDDDDDDEEQDDEYR